MDKFNDLVKLQNLRASEESGFEIGRIGSSVDGSERVVMSRAMYENLVGLLDGFIDDPNEVVPGVVLAKAYHEGKATEGVSQEKLESASNVLAS
jgi:hypothetical protein